MRANLSFPVAISLIVLGSGPVSAQVVELRLRENSTRTPIAGAIVRLLRNDSAVVQGLTNERGLLVLRAAVAATYRLKIDRIGFTGFQTAPFSLRAGETLQVELPIVSRPMSLPTLVVSGKSQCGFTGAEGAPTASLWEEVRKALTANVLTQRQQAVPLVVREFEREVTRSGRVLREWVFSSGLTRGQPFHSLPAAELARLGFVYIAKDTTIYSAPDASLLLADEFVATHCFRAAPGKGQLVGLVFTPVFGREVPDVSGTLWVDRSTSELQFLEYSYTGLVGDLARADLGGRVEFRRLPAGTWIISYWHVRMPRLELSTLRGVGNIPNVTREIARMVGYIDRGGRTAIATDAGGRLDRAVLTGQIYDSIASGGLAGVVVTVRGSADSIVSDAGGRFTLVVAKSGDQVVIVSHAKLGLLRDATTRDVLLSLGDTTEVQFAVPSLATFGRSLCGSPKSRTGLLGLAVGADGEPASNLEVQVTWRTSSGGIRSERSRPNGKGVYAICDLEPDQTLAVRLQDGSRTLLELPVQLGWKEFRWVELRPAGQR